MCSGAMLHARLKRVVFGAPEPKTGAAGSVINLFGQTQLNHQTTLLGGVLAEQSTALLQDFFRRRRNDKRNQARANHPLRDHALRTPDAAFDKLPDYPWPPRFVSDLPALDGLRLHYIDCCEATECGQTLTYLCLHSSPLWTYFYRHIIPGLLQAGHRVVAPDLIGFGKSDKPKKEGFHSLSRHRQIVLELIERLNLSNIVLLVGDQGDFLSLTLPLTHRRRFQGLQLASVLPGHGDFHQEMKNLAYAAPFPDNGHRAALRAFAALTAMQNFRDNL